MEGEFCISHLGTLEFNDPMVEEIAIRLRNSADKLALPLEEELALLEQLTQFELGRFLLQNKGLNGYWTDYIISGDHRNVLPDSFEDWCLSLAPLVRATQERFAIFQEEIQKKLVSEMNLASIPCGAMNDLLKLDYSNAQDVHLVGIDIDPESIELAQNNIAKTSLSATVEKYDAWTFKRDEDNKFDLITSNGPHIYEPSEERLVELYKNFYEALRPNGYLVTSFIAKPPMVDPNSSWKNVDMAHLIKQKAVFADIIQAKWQNSWSELEMRNQLEQAGFEIEKIIYDSQGMFPTVLAIKK